jgi:putative flippase GtrA
MFDNTRILKFINHSSSKYFIVGLLAFGIDYAVLLSLYYLAGLNLELATSIGFIVGFMISFTVNKQWVFGQVKQRKHLVRQVVEYVCLLIFNFIFTVVTVNFLNQHGVPPVVGKLMVMGLIMCWNYALFRWVIFVQQLETKI